MEENGGKYMSKDKFIEHKDPTAPIKWEPMDTSGLPDFYTKLTDEEKNVVMAKFLGMNHVPVDILTFLFDDYFLGGEQITNHGNSVFKYWIDKLQEMFPSPIFNRYPFISLSGSVGSGKSFISKIIGMYNYHKLDCCTNVYKSVGLAGGTKIAMAFFHANFETSKKDGIGFWKFILDQSPYFRSQYNNPPIRLIPSGPQSTGSVLGSQLIYTVNLIAGSGKVGEV